MLYDIIFERNTIAFFFKDHQSYSRWHDNTSFYLILIYTKYSFFIIFLFFIRKCIH